VPPHQFSSGFSMSGAPASDSRSLVQSSRVQTGRHLPAISNSCGGSGGLQASGFFPEVGPAPCATNTRTRVPGV
jgi:hypothetical protein